MYKRQDQIKADYEEIMRYTYKNSGNKTIQDIDISTAFNMNRELFVSCKFIILSLKDFLLNDKEAEVFDNLATFPFEVKT